MSTAKQNIIVNVTYTCDVEEMNIIAEEVNTCISNYGQLIKHVADVSQVTEIDLSDK